jgi:hypothetical protein
MFGISWLLDYLLTTAIRRIKEWRSDAWPMAQGTVHTSTSSGRTAEVGYTYVANAEHYAGSTPEVFGSRIQRGPMQSCLRRALV